MREGRNAGRKTSKNQNKNTTGMRERESSFFHFLLPPGLPGESRTDRLVSLIFSSLCLCPPFFLFFFLKGQRPGPGDDVQVHPSFLLSCVSVKHSTTFGVCLLEGKKRRRRKEGRKKRICEKNNKKKCVCGGSSSG